MTPRWIISSATGHDAGGHRGAPCEALGRLAKVYPFVVMFPFIFITDEPNLLAIAGWGLTWCLLGYAMWSSAVL
jgi:hypothetical protein